MLQIRDVFLGQTTCRILAVEGRHADVPGDTTKLVQTSCYLVGENNCTRKQHT